MAFLLTSVGPFPNTRQKPKSVIKREIYISEATQTENETKGEGLLTCSAFSVSSIKICCNFSLTKLMQNCSKPFFCGGEERAFLLVGYAMSLANTG